MTIRGVIASFTAATAFFTQIPVKAAACHGGRLADAAWAFPLVGAGIGGLAGLAFLLVQLLGLGDWLAAVLAVLVSIVLTGALHEDGLAGAAIFAMGVLAHRRIGGYTGDVLGAFQQVGEIVILLTAAAK